MLKMKKNKNIVISIQNVQKWRFWRFINRKTMGTAFVKTMAVEGEELLTRMQKNDYNILFTLKPVNQTDNNPLLVLCLHIGTIVNPDATPNPLSESR